MLQNLLWKVLKIDTVTEQLEVFSWDKDNGTPSFCAPSIPGDRKEIWTLSPLSMSPLFLSTVNWQAEELFLNIYTEHIQYLGATVILGWSFTPRLWNMVFICFVTQFSNPWEASNITLASKLLFFFSLKITTEGKMEVTDYSLVV